MDGMAMGLGILVAGALVGYLSRPWWPGRSDFQPDPEPVSNGGGQELATRRESLLAALRDLDFDYTLHKVTAEDYRPLRQALLGEVAAIMTELDEQQTAAEANIEAEVSAARQKLQAGRSHQLGRTGPPCLTCGQVSEAGDLYCRSCGTKLQAACPQCGELAQSADRFCTGCGIELALALSG